MAKVTTQAECRFCKRKFSKSSMSRHLIACPARRAASQARSGQPGLRPAQLFHLRVEGRDYPEYWMDIEIPTDAALYDLDEFLRDMWLECCGHLSAFTIAGHEYVADDPDFDLMPPILPLEMLSGEGDEPEPPPGIATDLGLTIARLTGASEEAQAVFLEETKKIIGDHDPNEPLTDEQSMQITASIGRMLGMDEAMINLVMEDIKAGVGPDDDDFFGEGSMDTRLSAVLKPGLKFYHEYDFGSTTRLTLRVVEERAGCAPEIEPDDEDAAAAGRYDLVTVLAQNEPPMILCDKCHLHDSVVICTDCGQWLCKDCATTHRHHDMFLPVVNSPRVGVCGYDGRVYFGDDEEGEDE